LQVTFSNDFKKSLLRLKSREQRMRVLRKIHRLSLGLDFSKGSTDLCSTSDPSPTDQEGMVKTVWVMSDLHLLWSVDVNRNELVEQIIKIWNLLRLCKVPSFLSRLSAAFDVYSPQYLDRCRQRQSSRYEKITYCSLLTRSPGA
jgi:hypothetical protein